MKTLYRCNNAPCKQGLFEADVPVCPACKVDGRVPEDAPYVTALLWIHFDPPDPRIPSRGLHVLACRPDTPIFGHRATGAHDVVNCRACRESKAFKDSYKPPQGEGPPAEVVVVDQGKKELRRG